MKVPSLEKQGASSCVGKVRGAAVASSHEEPGAFVLPKEYKGPVSAFVVNLGPSHVLSERQEPYPTAQRAMFARLDVNNGGTR